MTKSELIARLAAQFPQLVAKDAELAVKMILDAMAESLAEGRAHRDPRLRQLRPELPAAARRAQSEVGREGAGAGEVRAALQGRQGTARAGRLQATGRAGACAAAGARRHRRDRPRFARARRARRERQPHDAHASRWIVGARAVPRCCWFLSLQEHRARSRCTFYLDWSWQAPLVFVVLLAFAVGVARGLLAGALRASRSSGS